MGGKELYLKDEVYRIVGCAMEVLNGVGHRFHEKRYENALAVEFRLRGIPFRRQPIYVMIYRDVKIGEHIPDLIAFDQVVIDAKTIDHVTSHERGQMINYLRVTHMKVGVLLNFKYAKLEWERIVL